MRFVETPIFPRAIRSLLSDEECCRLQVALVLRPAQGALIRGSGGLRKLRWGAAGRGRRGGIRIIYHVDPATDCFLMLFAYPKGSQDDLTPAQLLILRRLVEEELR